MSSACSHLDRITVTALPAKIAGCTDCRAVGDHSAEPGQAWSWCYLGNLAFVLEQP